MRRPLFAFVLLVFVSARTFAQGPVFEWGGQISGPHEIDAVSVTVDNEGNVITLGYFLGTIDTDPSSISFPLEESGLSHTDIFVQKLDSSGNFLWAAQFGGSLPDGSIGTPAPLATVLPASGVVKTDYDGNIFMVTIFKSDSLDADPSAGDAYIYLQEEAQYWTYDYLVIKLDSEGNYVWAHSFGGPREERIHDMEVDSEGSLYITGRFQDSIDVDPDPLNEVMLVSNDEGYVGFIQKLNSEGELVWAEKTQTTSGDAYPTSLELDAEDALYVYGGFSDTFDFDFGPSIFALTQMVDSVSRHGFVLKLNAAGEFVRVTQLHRNSSTFAADPHGNLALVGNYPANSTLDINPSPTEEFL